MRSIITGIGSYLPEHIRTNADLEAMVDTNDAWIVERTGIRTRHIAAKGELTSHLATKAALAAIDHAGIDAKSIDCLLVATTTPDDTLPATATKVQHQLGVESGFALDIAAACSGFVYGLATADAYIQAGLAKTVLVIGAETFSRVVDWTDRSTCILFGDGAGAAIVQAGTPADDRRGILATNMFSDGKYGSILAANGGVSSTQTAGTVVMAGKEVFRHAVTKMTEATEQALAKAGLTAKDIDWLVPHQANKRILDSAAQKLGVATEKAIMTLDRHANTSAASIPLALADAVQSGKIKRGDIVAMPALGAGLTWGCAIVRW